jgi:hypothetical protein
MTAKILTSAPVPTMTGADVVLDADVIGRQLVVHPEDGYAPFNAGRIVDTLIGDNGPAVDVVRRGETIRVTLSASALVYRVA